jgi:hypothetical protein
MNKESFYHDLESNVHTSYLNSNQCVIEKYRKGNFNFKTIEFDNNVNYCDINYVEIRSGGYLLTFLDNNAIRLNCSIDLNILSFGDLFDRSHNIRDKLSSDSSGNFFDASHSTISVTVLMNNLSNNKPIYFTYDSDYLKSYNVTDNKTCLSLKSYKSQSVNNGLVEIKKDYYPTKYVHLISDVVLNKIDILCGNKNCKVDAVAKVCDNKYIYSIDFNQFKENDELTIINLPNNCQCVIQSFLYLGYVHGMIISDYQNSIMYNMQKTQHVSA